MHAGGGGGATAFVLLRFTALPFLYTGKSLAEVLRNEHLVTVGNDSDGISKIWIVPRLSTSSPFVISLDSNFTVSSAYSAQSTKSRELTVISSYIGTSVSLHHLLVPLENSILNVTVKYNGSAGANETITVVRPHTLYRFPSSPCSHMCSSLGVHKIRGSLYALCASSTRICRCQLIPSNHQEHFDTTPLLSNCRLLLYPNADITVTRISDILSFSSIRNRPHLLFVLDKNIYQDNIVYDTAVLPIPFSTSPNCQVVLRLQIVESRLLIYCTNYTMVEYHFDEEHLFQSENHQYYPCSETANFSVNVTRNERADIHYQRLTDDSELRQQLLPPLGVSHFKVGECITYDGHDLFLYTNLDRSNNLHLINSSCSIFIPHNFSTSNLYERPLTVAERYIMIHSPDDQSTYVLDLENIEMPIITLEDIVPFQLATVISNLSFTINIEPTPSLSRTSFRSDSVLMSTATAMMPTDETDPPFIEQETIIWPPILIAIVVIICLCVLINGAVLIVWQCRYFPYYYANNYSIILIQHVVVLI